MKFTLLAAAIGLVAADDQPEATEMDTVNTQVNELAEKQNELTDMVEEPENALAEETEGTEVEKKRRRKHRRHRRRHHRRGRRHPRRHHRRHHRDLDSNVGAS